MDRRLAAYPLAALAALLVGVAGRLTDLDATARFGLDGGVLAVTMICLLLWSERLLEAPTSTTLHRQPRRYFRRTPRPSTGAPDATATNTRALLLLCVAELAVASSTSATIVALPQVGRSLHIDQVELSLVIAAYALPFGCLSTVGGSLGDIFGRTRMFMLGNALFALASLAAGLAWSEPTLIAARALQGIGGTFVATSALGVLVETFRGHALVRAIGVWVTATATGGIVGVLGGGALADGASWRWVQFVDVPIGLACALFAIRWLRESRLARPVFGAYASATIILSAALALAFYRLLDTNSAGWTSVAAIARLAGAAILVGLFLLIGARALNALVPLRIFRVRGVIGGILVALPFGACALGVLFFLSLYLQQVLHDSALDTGVSLLPLATTSMLSMLGADRIGHRYSPKALLIAGLLLLGVGFAWFSRIPAHGGTFSGSILGPSLVVGIGLGIPLGQASLVAIDSVPPDQAGPITGVIGMTQHLGGAFGLAILAMIANAHTGHLLHSGQYDSTLALTKGFSQAFLVGAGFAVVGALLALLIVPSRPHGPLNANRTHRVKTPAMSTWP